MDDNFNNCIYDYTSKITKIFLDKFNGKTINSNDCNLDLIMIKLFGYSNNTNILDTVIEEPDDSNIEIISGLKEDDLVITGPYNTVTKILKPGSKVETKIEEQKE